VGLSPWRFWLVLANPKKTKIFFPLLFGTAPGGGRLLHNSLGATILSKGGVGWTGWGGGGGGLGGQNKKKPNKTNFHGGDKKKTL